MGARLVNARKRDKRRRHAKTRKRAAEAVAAAVAEGRTQPTRR
jgi:hypothetical protein